MKLYYLATKAGMQKKSVTKTKFDKKYLIGAIIGVLIYLIGVQIVNSVFPQTTPSINRVTPHGDGVDVTR